MREEIAARNLTGGYEKRKIFTDFNFAVPKGKITSLLGPNGSGKSTILKTMSRILQPMAGEVVLDGNNIRTMASREIARQLAVLPQSSNIPDAVTVKELVALGRFPYRKMFTSLTREDFNAIDWAIDAADVAEFVNKDVNCLSGGQRQRVWIAMALAQKTNILFLDEPTTYLDVSHQLEILKLLSDLNKKEQVTVVMVLHDLNHASMFSDHLLVIKEGVKKYEGPPQEVLTKEMLRDVFNIEAEVMNHPVVGSPICLPY